VFKNKGKIDLNVKIKSCIKINNLRINFLHLHILEIEIDNLIIVNHILSMINLIGNNLLLHSVINWESIIMDIGRNGISLIIIMPILTNIK
jgi:hypothetical protein